MPDSLTLDEFNRSDPDGLRPVLRSCTTSPAWADRVLVGRPYTSVEDVVAAARRAVLDLEPAELDAALAGHPRIGERPGGAHAAGAGFSRGEQSGVRRDLDTPGDDSGTAARLAGANARYEERFGHVFLIRASGRDAAEILTELERRVGNDPDTERGETAAQLAEITALRVRQVLAR